MLRGVVVSPFSSAAVLATLFIFISFPNYGDCARSKEVPMLSAPLMSHAEIHRLQDEFLDSVDTSSAFKNADNFTSTLKAFNSEGGKLLIRSLFDVLVPTVGHDDGHQLVYDFYEKFLGYVPPKISKNLIKIEKTYNSVGSIPLTLSALALGGESSPLVELVNEFLPSNYNVTDFIQRVTKTLYLEDSNDKLLPNLINLAKPTIDSFLVENNIDLQTEGIMKLFSSLSALSTGGKDGQKNDFNPMTLLMPIMGMLSKQKEGSNNIMETVMSMMGPNNNGAGKMMEGVMGLLNSGGKENGGSKLMEGVMGLLSSGGKENNLMESVMGMLGGEGGKVGGDNMLGMMMSLMGGLGEKKKQNDKLEMLATALKFMSKAGSGSGKDGDFGGLADMAMNFLGNGLPEKDAKRQVVKDTPKKTPPKSQSSKYTSSERLNQKSRLIEVLEPAILKLHTNKECHPKLAAVMDAGNSMLNKKSMDIMTFMTAAVPLAMSQIPGGGELMAEITESFADVGINNMPFAQILASVTNEGECMSLARKAAPHAAKVVMMLSNQQIQDTIAGAVSKQATTALDGLGMKGVTLSNWSERIGPMIGMMSTGLPIQPVPVLQATQEYLTTLLTNVRGQLAAVRGKTHAEVVSALEYELGTILHNIGSVEHNLDLQKTRGNQCIAQVICRLCRKEEGIKGAIINSYSTARGLSFISADVSSRLLLLRAATFSGACETEFICASLPKNLEAHHSSLDFEEAGHHQEL